ncbi:unnamed protein product, partial [Mesorhabditis spiculigera]
MTATAELYSTLFNGYSNLSIPTNTFPLVVDVYMHFIYVLSLDESEETIKLITFLNYYWTDGYLQWDVAVDPVNAMVVPASELWRPDVVCTSCAEVSGILDDKRVEVPPSGYIGFGFPEVMISRCPLNIRAFPFDTQTCQLTLQVMSYDASQVVLKPGEGFLGEDVRGTTEWDLGNVTAAWRVDSVRGTGYMQIELVIKRNSTCYVWVLMVPTFIACNLAVMGTFLPSVNTGTRFSKVLLNVCVLLTMMVLLDIAAQDIPKTSILPQLAWYIFIEMLICFIAGLISIVILLTHHFATLFDLTPPSCLTCLVCEAPAKQNDDDVKKEPRSTSALLSQLGAIRGAIRQRERSAERRLQWIRILDRVDIFLLIIFIVVNSLIFMGSVIKW